MTQAKCIHYDAPTERLVAVYEPGTDLEVLRPIAQRIAAHASVRAEVKVKRVKQGGRLISIPGIEITSPGGNHYRSTCVLVKQLTNPELAFTAVSGVFRVLLCTCGQIVCQIETGFLPGLEPDDVESFSASICQEIDEIPPEPVLRALRGQRTQAVLLPLDAAYRKHGADVAELRLEAGRTPSCIH